AGSELSQAAVGEGIAQECRTGGLGHPVGVGGRQQECCEGKAGEPERRWVCRWCQHERSVHFGGGQGFSSCRGVRRPSRGQTCVAARWPAWRHDGRREMEESSDGRDRRSSASFAFTCGPAAPPGRPALRVTLTRSIVEAQFYLCRKTIYIQ